MNSKTPFAILEIVRPLNVLIMMMVVGAAVFISGVETFDWIQILVAACVGGCIGGAANAINDFFDIDIDRINRPDRPLPRGAVSKRSVVLLWLILSLVGISLNLFLNSHALWISFAAVIVLYWYSAVFKRTVLFGNVVVGLMTALAFVYGGVVAGSPENSWFPALFAFLINVGREIVKDAEDMEGDKRCGARTFPIVFGTKAAFGLTTMIFLLLIGATLYAYVSSIYGLLFLYGAIVVDAILLYVMVSLRRDGTTNNLRRISFLLKIDMVLGLVAIYLGTRMS